MSSGDSHINIHFKITDKFELPPDGPVSVNSQAYLVCISQRWPVQHRLRLAQCQPQLQSLRPHERMQDPDDARHRLMNYLFLIYI